MRLRSYNIEKCNMRVWGFFLMRFILWNMISGIKRKVFILGIGGISLSAMAEIMLKKGHVVAGYDKTPSHITKRLEANGIPIIYDEKQLNKIKSSDVVIFSSAFDENSAGMKIARSSGVQILSRAEALELISLSFNKVIAVAGSHGKTTTTAITSTIFDLGGLDFIAHIGGEVVGYDSNLIYRGDEVFLTEACEYKRNFLYLAPNIGVILNMDLDHTDVYSSQEEITEAFIDFSNKIQSGGVLIVNLDSVDAEKLLMCTNKDKRIVTYSLKDEKADYFVNDWACGEKLVFSLRNPINQTKQYFLNSFFEHNIYNAVASIIIAEEVGIKNISLGLESFKGVKRRFEHIGHINGADVFLDYAHHPTELKKVIVSTKQHTKGKVYVIFQPHTYSRTKSFWGEFVKSLAEADSVVMYPIYPAREKALAGVTSKRMAEDLRRLNKICYYNESLEEIWTYLGYFVKKEDIVLVLGAGDIEKFREVLENKGKNC